MVTSAICARRRLLHYPAISLQLGLAGRVDHAREIVTGRTTLRFERFPIDRRLPAQAHKPNREAQPQPISAC